MIADVLVGTGQLIEEGGLAAVLVAGQGKGQRCAFGQGIFVGLDMILAVFTQTGVSRINCTGCRRGPGLFVGRDDADFFGIGQTEGQHVTVNTQLHGVAHGGILDKGDVGAGDDTHIEEVLTQSAFAADGGDCTGRADLQIAEGHIFDGAHKGAPFYNKQRG